MRKFIYFPLKIDAENTERVHEGLRQALELLRQTTPDTFLGRKSYEPYPKEAEGD
ncbi:hypothetical protein S58_33360 [Bradyrhizobium oligotrophicum S58]|uniref:Uncharacterized protein n=1 Tax=Bradyrhizobium oligotrophicum S58 TaxID=1245469 RepID=M4Z7M3_9BRAD|nr:hypothetical protein [Bradyrhizobium oligotrophicum]BAM89332.1 hypothetical protein S58_33360 [Bradyrhizobium oligotrophicum S58]